MGCSSSTPKLDKGNAAQAEEDSPSVDNFNPLLHPGFDNQQRNSRQLSVAFAAPCSEDPSRRASRTAANHSASSPFARRPSHAASSSQRQQEFIPDRAGASPVDVHLAPDGEAAADQTPTPNSRSLSETVVRRSSALIQLPPPIVQERDSNPKAAAVGSSLAEEELQSASAPSGSPRRSSHQHDGTMMRQSPATPLRSAIRRPMNSPTREVHMLENIPAPSQRLQMQIDNLVTRSLRMTPSATSSPDRFGQPVTRRAAQLVGAQNEALPPPRPAAELPPPAPAPAPVPQPPSPHNFLVLNTRNQFQPHNVRMTAQVTGPPRPFVLPPLILPSPGTEPVMGGSLSPLSIAATAALATAGPLSQRLSAEP